jgi:hypothetical protein
MNKKFFIIISLVLLAALVAGCDQIPQLKQIRDTYLQTRVVQLVTQMATLVPAEGTSSQVTDEQKAVETQALPEIPTATLPSFPKDVTETPTSIPPTAVPTEIPTLQPTFTAIPTAITPTETPKPAPTFTPVPTMASTDPAVYLGKSVWKDAFNENLGWSTVPDELSTISIANGVVTLTAKSTLDTWRLAPTDSLTNTYVEAIFTPGICDANDHFGIMFHVPDLVTANQGYEFGITCDGRYLLRKFDGNVGTNGSMVSLIPWTPSAEIRTGANQTNRIGIMTINDRLIMFINGVLVNEVKDKTYPQGYIGIFLGSRVTKNFTVKVDDLAYWKNPTTS